MKSTTICELQHPSHSPAGYPTPLDSTGILNNLALTSLSIPLEQQSRSHLTPYRDRKEESETRDRGIETIYVQDKYSNDSIDCTPSSLTLKGMM